MIQNVLVAVIVLLAFFYMMRFYYKRFASKKKSPACSGCEKTCEAAKEHIIHIKKKKSY